MPAAPTLDQLRQHAVARTLFTPTTLPQAIRRLGFVQADPIRAPARAQDLTLRHRVRDYRAGDLERRYPALAVEEDFFVNYGFLPRDTQRLMHPRTARTAWTKRRSSSSVGGFTAVCARCAAATLPQRRKWRLSQPDRKSPSCAPSSPTSAPRTPRRPRASCCWAAANSARRC